MEKINIAELLKDCPKGMELDCTIYEDVVFHDIADRHYPIRVRRKQGGLINLNAYGCMDNKIDSKCVIFPKGKTTWEGFVPPCKFKDGDVVTSVFQGAVQGTGIFDYEEQSEAWIHACINRNNEFSTDGYLGHVCNLRYATEEEKQKLFDAIKTNGYKWDAETKTLEKLFEPKFKVGDRIRNKKTLDIFRITNIDEDSSYCGLNTFWICDQDNFGLVPDKFDITALKPFESRVLVRNSDSGFWKPAFWGIYEAEKTNEHQYRNYLTTEGFVRHCIPYNDETKHLLGTTDNCDEYYKTWEE